MLRLSGFLGSDTPLTIFLPFFLDTQGQGSFIVILVIKTHHAFGRFRLHAVTVDAFFLFFSKTYARFLTLFSVSEPFDFTDSDIISRRFYPFPQYSPLLLTIFSLYGLPMMAGLQGLKSYIHIYSLIVLI